jgi:hypothetical protein
MRISVPTHPHSNNPRLVATGLDLLAFPTLLFFEIDHSLFTMVQASRRAWRIIQDRPCKVFYPFYCETMEHQAVNLIGRNSRRPTCSMAIPARAA